MRNYFSSGLIILGKAVKQTVAKKHEMLYHTQTEEKSLLSQFNNILLSCSTPRLM